MTHDRASRLTTAFKGTILLPQMIAEWSVESLLKFCREVHKTTKAAMSKYHLTNPPAEEPGASNPLPSDPLPSPLSCDAHMA
jgi:hypothetical protein